MTQFISPNRFPKNAGYSVQDRFGLKNDDYEGFSKVHVGFGEG